MGNILMDISMSQSYDSQHTISQKPQTYLKNWNTHIDYISWPRIAI